ncbi:uncharacterized protein LOC123871707 [Maniola jurtina]|uniref:uncharacterized protein LOC123871707 n=1 Tax=Maniola jurtina TaxID=191418 RepID=UPI001E68A6CF|nr:uncharacterized protein LOC123871707 [Maniola jurtina]
MTSRNLKVSRKTLINIVLEVQKRPCLWNPDDEDHKNRGRVAVSWEEITAALNIPETVIRAKWKSMRDIFKREMKKCKTNSQGELRYTGKWRHFKLMWFLHKNKNAQLVDYDPKEVSNTSTESEEFIKEEVNDRDMDESDGNNVPFEFAVDFQPEQDPLPVKRRQSSEVDYDLMFLKSLVPYFRELEPVRKLRIRSKIQDIIINEINAQGNYNSTH